MTRTMKQHSTDLVSLVAGVIFLGIVGTWALGQADLLDGLRGWILPVLLIGVGLIGLIGIRPRRTDSNTTDTSASDSKPAEPARRDWTDDEVKDA